MQKFKKIALIGGAGFVGAHVAEQLIRHGAHISIATRRREGHKATLLPLPAAELVETDIHHAGKLEQFLAGHDAVISMVGILHGSRDAFEKAHVQLTGKLIAACKSQGIRRIIHISALGASESGPSDYLQTKGKAERLLRDSGLDVTILRPSVIFGAGDSFLTLFAKLTAALPVLPLSGANTRFAPVWVEDVARAVQVCLDERASIGRTLELAGPCSYTLRQLVEYCAALGGHHCTVVALPESLAMLQAGLMELLPGTPPMSRDNVRSLRVDNVSQQPFPAVLGFRPAALEAVAPLYLGERESNRQLDRYREHAAR